jgi:glutaconate CoA-transferase subunit B
MGFEGVDALMVAAIADVLPDSGYGFVGVGGSGRAYTLVSEMPLAAAWLVQRRGSSFEIQLGPLIGVDLANPPKTASDRDIYGWDAAALTLADSNFLQFQGGAVAVGFASGAQIDCHGNVNVTEVRGRSGPIRLGGALAVPEILACAGHVVLLADLSPRTFVPEVEFVSGFGHLFQGVTREELGLPGAGPTVVVTDHGVLRFKEGRMHLAQYFSHTSPDEILALVGFPLDVTAATQAPEIRIADRQALAEFQAPQPLGV